MFDKQEQRTPSKGYMQYGFKWLCKLSTPLQLLCNLTGKQPATCLQAGRLPNAF